MLLFWSINTIDFSTNRIDFFPSPFRFALNGFWWIILSCGRCEYFHSSFGITNACGWWRLQVYLRSVLDWIISRIVRHVFHWFWCHDNVVSYGTGIPVTLDNLEVVSKGLFSFLHLVRMIKDNVKSRQGQDNVKSWEALFTDCSSLDLIFSSITYNTSSIIYEGIGEVSILLFFLLRNFTRKKKHKMQTSKKKT